MYNKTIKTNFFFSLLFFIAGLLIGIYSPFSNRYEVKPIPGDFGRIGYMYRVDKWTGATEKFMLGEEKTKPKPKIPVKKSDLHKIEIHNHIATFEEQGPWRHPNRVTTCQEGISTICFDLPPKIANFYKKNSIRHEPNCHEYGDVLTLDGIVIPEDGLVKQPYKPPKIYERSTQEVSITGFSARIRHNLQQPISQVIIKYYIWDAGGTLIYTPERAFKTNDLKPGELRKFSTDKWSGSSKLSDIPDDFVFKCKVVSAVYAPDE